MEEVTPKSGEWQREENDLYSMDTPRNVHRMQLHLLTRIRQHPSLHTFTRVSCKRSPPLHPLCTRARIYMMHYSSARAENSVSCVHTNDTCIDGVSPTGYTRAALNRLLYSR